MREDDVTGAIRQRYTNRIRELQQERARIDREIAALEDLIGSLQRIEAYEHGNPLDAPVKRISRLVDFTSEPVDTTDRLPRGWLKGKIVEYVRAVTTVAGKPFSGSDVANWIKGQGHKLSLPQYNRIFMELKQMAEKGEEVRREGKLYMRLGEVAPELHSEEARAMEKSNQEGQEK